jgi:predicted nucleic acid-binding Zn ribbon protein
MRADVLQEATANDQDETETTCEHCGASLLVRIGYYVEVVR